MRTWTTHFEDLDDHFGVIVVIRGSTWTPPAHLGGPDLDFIDFGWVLAPPWELLLGPFGDGLVIFGAQMGLGIRKLLFYSCCNQNRYPLGGCIIENNINTMVFIRFPVNRKQGALGMTLGGLW